MHDKPLTIATYAAGASLAAAALVYVFGPTFLLDDDAANASSSARKRGVVGLSNPANDCFVNSVLQALAGLTDLRVFLIREMHRRELDGPEVYQVTPETYDPEEEPKAFRPEKIQRLRNGLVSAAVKDMLDKLNERPLYRKTISAQGFLAALEAAFRTRISRQQQDAQEFLQILAERMCEEYYAGKRARKQALKRGLLIPNPHHLHVHHAETDTASESAADGASPAAAENGQPLREAVSRLTQNTKGVEIDEEEDEDGFPFEGKLEAQIECLTCGFKPKPTESSFVSLTLHVPQASSTTLNACFDGMLKVEHIDDFKCEYCRLEHAVQVKMKQLATATKPEVKAKLESDIAQLQKALKEDPEEPPKDVELPDSSEAPKRRIARHMRISSFPKVLAIHLSRSIFSASAYSTKNMAKVQFPETLPLGGILDQRKYRLLGLVTHKGGHNSGHYESFRRQTQPHPFSTPISLGTEGVYSHHASPMPSTMPSAAHSTSHSPHLSSLHLDSPAVTPPIPTLETTHSTASTSASSFSLASSSSSQQRQKTSPRHPQQAPTSTPRDTDHPLNHTETAATAATTTTSWTRPGSLSAKASMGSLGRRRTREARKLAQQRENRWWRISDEKVKESKTAEVLRMQREVYLLFYEMIR